MSTIHEITSPIPGTYYSKESPTSPAFVTVGATVAVGDTVGLVEVMKMFNPIVSDVSGTVVEICIQTDDPVDIGDVVMRVEVA